MDEKIEVSTPEQVMRNLERRLANIEECLDVVIKVLTQKHEWSQFPEDETVTVDRYDNRDLRNALYKLKEK